MDALTYLTYLGVLILVGLIITYFSNRAKIPNIILLILAGMLIHFGIKKYAQITNTAKLEFPIVFIAGISILALVMIVFDSTSKFKYKELDDFSISALKYSLIFLFINLIVFSLIVYLFMDSKNYFLALMFAALMSGTSPGTVLYMLKETNHKVLQFLKVESIINTPLIVLFPFIILNIMEKFEGVAAFTNIISQIMPFLQQIASGIGAGLLIGLIILKLLRKIYSKTLGPLIIICAALLSFILAENIGGNGVLAVTTLGLMFGNVYVKQKIHLQEFSRIFSNFLEITVFILIGILIDLPANWVFFLKSGALFLVYLLIRYLSLSFTFKTKFKLREKIFIALNSSKGIAVAVVAALLLSYSLRFQGKDILFASIPGGQQILNYILAFILYSIIISTIAIKTSRFFIKKEVVQEDDIEIVKKSIRPKKLGKREKNKKTKINKLKRELKKIKGK